MQNILIIGGVIVAVGVVAFVFLGGVNEEDGQGVVSVAERQQIETAPDMAVGDSEMSTNKDIIDIAVETDIVSTLVTAVTAGELVETLKGDGPFTVFAPTNEAFDNLDEGTVEALLLPENLSELQSVLTYHVVPGRVLSSDLVDGMEVSTVQGEMVRIGVSTAGVTINDTARVIASDIEATNGVIHLIDTVLLP